MASFDIFDIIRFLDDSGINEKHIVFADRLQDMTEHWDFKVKTSNGDKKIDIKSLKEAASQDWHWVELVNVHGDRGWVRGDANLILFECPNSWLMVDRQLLLEFTLEKTKNGNLIYTKDFNLLKKGDRYQRKKWDRKDEITLVSVKELMSLNPKIISKKVLVH